MKNLFKKTTEKEIREDDIRLFNLGKKMISEIKPEKELLSKILEKVEFENVTNLHPIRNTTREEDGRSFINNPFSNFINNMNKNIKIFSGAVVVVAVVLVVFTFAGKNKIQNPQVAMNNVSENTSDASYKTSTKVSVGGVSVDTDSLVNDLIAADKSVDEPTIDDGDTLASLTNSNDYEIQ